MHKKITFEDFKDDIREILDIKPIGRLNYWFTVSLSLAIMMFFPYLSIFCIPYILLQVAKRAKDLAWPAVLPLMVWAICLGCMVVLALNGINPDAEDFVLKNHTSLMQIIVLVFAFSRMGAFLFFVLFCLKGSKREKNKQAENSVND